MKKMLLVVPFLLLALLAVGACSGARSSKSEDAGKAPAGRATTLPAAMPTPAPGIAPEQQISRDAMEKGKVAEGAAAAPSLATSDASAASAGGGPTDQIFDRKIIHDADLALRVKDVGDSFEAVRGIAAAAGGFVLDSSFYFEGERRVANVRIRVPAETFDDTLGRLRRLGVEVERETSTAKDVTEEFTDLEARLRNLEAAEAQYQSFLAQAKTIDEVLRVQRELNAIRDQIERTRGKLNVLARLSDMATISVRLYPADALAKVREKPDGWSPSEVASEAWESSLAFFRTVATGIITFGVYTWWIWVIVAIGLLIWRRSRSDHGRSPSTS